MTWSKDKQLGVWYFDSYTSRQFRNNQEKFADLQLKTYEFVMIGYDITHPLENSSELILSNVTYIPNCNSNFISLD